MQAPKRAMFLATVMLSSCASDTKQGWHEKSLLTESQLDDMIIEKFTSSNIGTGEYGFRGVSGRILTIMNLVHSEMKTTHAKRCESEPIERHIFLYKEDKDTVKIQTMPRFIPERWEPISKDPTVIDEREIFNFIPNTQALDGCEIVFLVEKKSKKILATQIIR